MKNCPVCNHHQRKEIEKEIRNNIKRVGKRWGISGQNVSYHKYNCMWWYSSLTIKKAEFCIICLEKEECKKHDLKKCDYWREYCEDIGRTA